VQQPIASEQSSIRADDGSNNSVNLTRSKTPKAWRPQTSNSQRSWLQQLFQNGLPWLVQDNGDNFYFAKAAVRLCRSAIRSMALKPSRLPSLT
jgi:hypothetical protein